MRGGVISFPSDGPPHRCFFGFCKSKLSNLAINPFRTANKSTAAALGTRAESIWDDAELLFAFPLISAAALLFVIVICDEDPPGGKGRVDPSLSWLVNVLLLLLLLDFRFLDFFCFSVLLVAIAKDDVDA